MLWYEILPSFKINFLYRKDNWFKGEKLAWIYLYILDFFTCKNSKVLEILDITQGFTYCQQQDVFLATFSDRGGLMKITPFKPSFCMIEQVLNANSWRYQFHAYYLVWEIEYISKVTWAHRSTDCVLCCLQGFMN